MLKPVIALTAGRNNLHTLRREVQSVWAGCSVSYVDSVLRSGGAPVLLPYLADKDSVRVVLESSDGLILTGGGDVVSLVYGEEPHIKSACQDPKRDEMEMEAARVALELGLPILGICRGIQLLNVALGGTLVQDIPSQIPGANKHYSAGMAPVLLHSVDIELGTLMHELFRTDSMAVNSWHHQSVKDLGQGLKVNCRARDGVIEGIESSEDKPVLALQCHPEEISATYTQFQVVFDWVVSEARKRRK